LAPFAGLAMFIEFGSIALEAGNALYLRLNFLFLGIRFANRFSLALDFLVRCWNILRDLFSRIGNIYLRNFLLNSQVWRHELGFLELIQEVHF
jgi:hypothetical protein